MLVFPNHCYAWWTLASLGVTEHLPTLERDKSIPSNISDAPVTFALPIKFSLSWLMSLSLLLFRFPPHPTVREWVFVWGWAPAGHKPWQPLMITWSNAPAQAGSPEASGPGLSLNTFSTFSKNWYIKNQQMIKLWQCLVTVTGKKEFPGKRTSLISLQSHCLWSCHWAALREPGSIFLQTLPLVAWKFETSLFEVYIKCMGTFYFCSRAVQQKS